MFGMGTGGSSLLSSPDSRVIAPSKLNNVLDGNLCSLILDSLFRSFRECCLAAVYTLRILLRRTGSCSQLTAAYAAKVAVVAFLRCTFRASPMRSWSSPRTISTGQLHTLLHFHLRPINHVVSMGPYQPALWEILS